MLGFIDPKERLHLQMVCKHWYDVVIPIGLSSVNVIERPDLSEMMKKFEQSE